MTTPAAGECTAENASPMGERVASLLDEVVRALDAGELTATSPERAYLVGAAVAVRQLASL